MTENTVWRRSRRDRQVHAFPPQQVAETNRIYLKAICSHVTSPAVLEPVVHVAGHWSALLDVDSCMACLVTVTDQLAEADRQTRHTATLSPGRAVGVPRSPGGPAGSNLGPLWT